MPESEKMSDKSFVLSGAGDQPLQLHASLVQGVFDILKSVFRDGKLADRAVLFTLKSNAKWGARDRKFVAEIAYDAVRWWRLIWALAEEEPGFETPSLQKFLAVQLAYCYGVRETKGISLEVPDAEVLLAKSNLLPIAIKESIPDWLYNYGLEQVGAEWDKELQASNQKALLYIRVNRKLSTPQKVIAALLEEGFIAKTTANRALAVSGKGQLTATVPFKNGWFEIQDAGSQEIAPFLQAAEGMRIIDACAGAGGKTLHLFDIVGAKSQILALDTESHKLDELRSRAGRAGADRIRTSVVQGASTTDRYADWADRLLLDVPCSGSGVLKRNPDTKWKLTTEEINRLLFQQSLLLQNYSRMLKSGGKMVYATCSLFSSENEKQVQHFVQANPGFFVEAEKRILPSEGGDGFYMARLVKNQKH